MTKEISTESLIIAPCIFGGIARVIMRHIAKFLLCKQEKTRLIRMLMDSFFTLCKRSTLKAAFMVTGNFLNLFFNCVSANLHSLVTHKFER